MRGAASANRIFLAFLLLFFLSATCSAASFYQSVAGGTVGANYSSGNFIGKDVNNSFWTLSTQLDWNRATGNNFNDSHYVWTKYNNAPPTPSNGTSSFGGVPAGTYPPADATSAMMPAVIKDGNTYKMWYTGYIQDNTGYYIVYATSSDGLNWTKYDSSVPLTSLRAEIRSDTNSNGGKIVRGSTGKGDNGGVLCPSVMKDGDTYKMWYTGMDSSNTYRIFYASSSNGIDWTKLDNNCVGASCSSSSPQDSNGVASTNGKVLIGSTGRGDVKGVYCPTVIKDDDNTYKMWYAGVDSSTYYRIFEATSPDGLAWTKVDNNCAGTSCGSSTTQDSNQTSTDGRIYLGSSGKGDYYYALIQPRVIKDGGVYKMWYTANGGSSLYRTYYATSPDGLTWTKLDNSTPSTSDSSSTNGRIPLGSAGGRGDTAYAGAVAIILDGNTYKIWYTGSASGTITNASRIYYATSSDGLNWNKYDNTVPSDSDSNGTNGKLPKGLDPRGDYSGSGDNHATVIKDGSTYKMWYTGGAGYHTYQTIYYATSPDAVTWTKYDNSFPAQTDVNSTNGRLGYGLGGSSGDYYGVGSPSVMKDGSLYRMWYEGDGADSKYRIYYAYSSDGLTWTKQNNGTEADSNTTGTQGRIPLGLTGSGDNSGVRYPAVIKDGSTYRMWYTGFTTSDTKQRVYEATSTDGLTWTKVDNSIPAVSDYNGTNGRVPIGSLGSDNSYIQYTAVIKDSNMYRMWYVSDNGTAKYAWSTDALTWYKYDNFTPAVTDTNVTNWRVAYGNSGKGDTGGLTAEAVLKDGNVYRMWYSANAGGGSPFANLFYASNNVTNWDDYLSSYFTFDNNTGATIYDRSNQIGATVGVTTYNFINKGFFDSNSLLLNGSNYVNLGNNVINYAKTNFSVSFWFSGISCPASGNTYLFSRYYSYRIRMCLSGVGNLGYEFLRASGNSIYNYNSGIDTVGTGWHQAALVFNDRNVYFYLDGNLLDTNTAYNWPTDPITTPGTGQIGGYNGEQVTAYMDDFKYYIRPLTQAEVVTDFNAFRNSKYTETNTIDTTTLGNFGSIKVNSSAGYKFGKEISAGEKFMDANMVGLWHLDDKNAQGWILNSATGLRDMNTSGGVDVNATGLWGTSAGWFGGSGYFNKGVTSDMNFSTGDWTISGWIKLGATSASAQYPFGRANSGANSEYGFWIPANTKNIQALVGNSACSGWLTSTAAGGIAQIGKWTQITMVKSGSNLLMFNNGVQISATGLGASAICANKASPDPFTIGSGGGTGAFNGSIEEVAAWNRALATSEVYDLYRKGVSRLDLNVYTCTDPACSTKTSSLYISDINNGVSTSLSGLSYARYLGYDAYFKPSTDFSNDTNGIPGVTSFIQDINVDSSPPTLPPDINIQTIAGYALTSPLPYFSAVHDGNLTVGFTAYSITNSRLLATISYGATNAQQRGTVVLGNVNLTSTQCNATDWNVTPATCTMSFSIQGITDGNYYLKVDLNDGTNSPTVAVSAVAMPIDNNAPAVGATTLGGGLNTYGTFVGGTGTVVGGAATDSTSGVNTSSCEYTINGSSWVAGSWNSNHCEGTGVGPVVNGTTYTFNTRVSDNATPSPNLGTGTATAAYTGDASPPTTTASGCAGTGWNSSNQVITLACSDGAGSGCGTKKYRIDGGAWQTYIAPFTLSTDGNHQVDYNSSDNVGNKESVNTTYCALNKLHPGVGQTTTSGFSTYDSFINGTGTIIGGTVAEGGSGINTSSCQYTSNGGISWGNASWDTNHCVYTGYGPIANGTSYTFNTRISDNATPTSNIGTGTATVSYTGDANAPTTTSDISSAWQNLDVNVHLSCSDGTGSGCTATQYRLDTDNTDATSFGGWQTYANGILVSGDGNWTIEYRSTDNVGNQESAKAGNVLIGPIGRLLTFKGGTPRSFFAPGETVTMQFDTNARAVPLISITDSTETPLVSEQAMTNITDPGLDYNSFTYDYTLNGATGWYSVRVGGQLFSNAFYQGEEWPDRYTSPDGNIYPFSFDLNVREPGAMQRWFEPVDTQINFDYYASLSSIRVLDFNGTSYLEVPSQAYSPVYSNGLVSSVNLAFLASLDEGETKNYVVSYSNSDYNKSYPADLAKTSSGNVFDYSNSLLEASVDLGQGGMVKKISSHIGTGADLNATNPMQYSPEVMIEPNTYRALNIANSSYQSVTDGPLVSKLFVSSTFLPVFDYNIEYTFYAKNNYFLVDENLAPLSAANWDHYYDSYFFSNGSKFSSFAYSSGGTLNNFDLNSSATWALPDANYLAFYNKSTLDSLAELFLASNSSQPIAPSTSVAKNSSSANWKRTLFSGTASTGDYFNSAQAFSTFNPWHGADDLNGLYIQLENPLILSTGSTISDDSTPPINTDINYLPADANDNADLNCYSTWTDNLLIDHVDISVTGPDMNFWSTQTVRSPQGTVSYIVPADSVHAGIVDCNFTAYDIARNSANADETLTVRNSLAPRIYSVSNSPDTNALLDPDTNVTINAGVVDYNGLNSVLIYRRLYDSNAGTWGDWSAGPMANDLNYSDSNMHFTYSFTTGPTDEHWQYLVNALGTNGLDSNSSSHDIYAYTDHTWAQDTNNLGLSSGTLGTEINVGSFTVTNTGDVNITFKLTSDWEDKSGITYDSQPETLGGYEFTVNAGESGTVPVGVIAKNVERSDHLTITIGPEDASAQPDSNTVAADVVSVSDGPFMFAQWVKASNAVTQGDTNVIFTARVTNAGIADANEVLLDWNFPGDWTVTSGYADENLGGTLLGVGSTLERTIIFTIGDSAAIGDKNISFTAGCCSLPEKSHSVTNTTTVIEKTVVPPVNPVNGGGTGNSGGGNGGGGGASPFINEQQKALFFQTKQFFELVRGTDDSFPITVENPLDGNMFDINLSVAGIMSKYLLLQDTSIPELDTNRDFNTRIKITSPKYFSPGEYEITFTIQGVLKQGYLQPQQFTETRTITLLIHDTNREAALADILAIQGFINDLNAIGLRANNLPQLLADSNALLANRAYDDIAAMYATAKKTYDDALSAQGKSGEVLQEVSNASGNGIDTPNTRRILKLAGLAMSRGEYALALDRLKEAELTFGLETKGEFNVWVFLWQHRVEAMAVLVILYILIYFAWMWVKLMLVNRALGNYNKENKLLIELIKNLQKKCFVENKISLGEYYDSLSQFETRVAEVSEGIIETESKKLALFNFSNAVTRLTREREKLLSFIRETQKEYFELGLIETRIYKTKMESMTKRLGEVEEQMVLNELVKTTRLTRGVPKYFWRAYYSVVR